MFFRMVY